MCVNHQKILTSKKLSSPVALFDLKSFASLLFLWKDKTYCLHCVLFGHKKVIKSLEKNDSKNRKQQKKKHSKNFKMFQREHRKIGKYCYIDF